MTTFEWFLLIVIVIVVPLIIAAVVTLWTIDQANKRKRANRKDAQIGVKRQAALSPEEVAARKAARAERDAETPGNDSARPSADGGTVTINNLGADEPSTQSITSASGNTVTINNLVEPESSGSPEVVNPDPGAASSEDTGARQHQ